MGVKYFTVYIVNVKIKKKIVSVHEGILCMYVTVAAAAETC